MSITIKELPIFQQPDDRCERLGAEYLTDAELLSIIFRNGQKGQKAIDLAICLLNLTDGSGLVGLHSLTIEEMMKVSGIGRVKAIQIKALCEISKRMAMASALPKLDMNNPKSIASYYMEKLRHKSQEHFVIALFNTKNEFLSDKLISIGTVNQTIVAPREIFSTALKYDAVNIALIHNHPSGDSKPSREDRICTNRLVEAGKMVGITVVDHIIIGDNNFYSFSEAGFL